VYIVHSDHVYGCTVYVHLQSITNPENHLCLMPYSWASGHSAHTKQLYHKFEIISWYNTNLSLIKHFDLMLQTFSKSTKLIN